MMEYAEKYFNIADMDMDHNQIISQLIELCAWHNFLDYYYKEKPAWNEWFDFCAEMPRSTEKKSYRELLNGDYHR